MFQKKMKTKLTSKTSSSDAGPRLFNSSRSSIQAVMLFLVVLLASCSLPTRCQAAPTSTDGYQYDFGEDLVDKVMGAMKKALDFLSADYSTMNVDGLFGVRIGQGNILQASEFCTKDYAACPDLVKENLNMFNRTIGVMADKAQPYLEAEDEEYYVRFHTTIDQPYVIPYESQSIAKYIGNIGSSADYGEKDGDVCLSSMMGTMLDKQTGRNVPKCTVTEQCWNLMARPGESGYSITHQLLFFIFGEKTGCLDKLDDTLRARASGVTSVKELEKVFCGHIVKELRKEAETGSVPQMQQDLFMEQSLLCGTLGYQEVFPVEWISMVLSWQNSNGCFSMPPSMMKVQGKLQTIFDDEKRLLKMLEDEAESIDRSTGTGRKLLRERILADECLSHKSGLGFGLIGTYLRYLVQTLYRRGG